LLGTVTLLLLTICPTNSVSSLIASYPELYLFNHIDLKDFPSHSDCEQEFDSLAEEIKPEKYAPPPPPSPPEIAGKIGDLLATLMRAPPEAIGVVKNLLERGASEVQKGPIPR